METPVLTSVPQPTGRKRIRVDAEKFCELLVSRRRLERADRPEEGVRGLLDLDRNVYYFSEERILSRDSGWHRK
jgi:hypothetical protein